MTPKYPLLGPENQFPNIPLVVICLIGAVVYFVGIFALCIGGAWVLSQLAKFVFS